MSPSCGTRRVTCARVPSHEWLAKLHTAGLRKPEPLIHSGSDRKGKHLVTPRRHPCCACSGGEPNNPRQIPAFQSRPSPAYSAIELYNP